MSGWAWLAGGGEPSRTGAIADQVDPALREEVELECGDELSFLSFLVTESLPRHIRGYDAYRSRPYTFLTQKPELVAAALHAAGAQRSPLLTGFEIRPRYALEVRLAELRNDHPFLGLFVDIATRRLVTAGLEELATAGVPLTGLDVIRREREPGRPIPVGRIETVTNGIVTLSESLTGETTVEASKVTLEGSSAVFRRCLAVLLGRRYEAFDEARRREEDLLLTGPARDRRSRVRWLLLLARDFGGSSVRSARVVERLSVHNRGCGIEPGIDAGRAAGADRDVLLVVTQPPDDLVPERPRPLGKTSEHDAAV